MHFARCENMLLGRRGSSIVRIPPREASITFEYARFWLYDSEIPLERVCASPSETYWVNVRTVLQFFHEALLSDWDCIYKLVSDDQELIEDAIKELVRCCALTGE